MDPRLSSVAAVVVVLAGCVGIEAPEPGAEILPSAASRIGAPLLQEHNHSDPSQHTASFGLHLVGHSYGVAEPSQIPTGVAYGELEWNAGWVYLCRMDDDPLVGVAPNGGFVIFDARNPAAPTPVGNMPGLGCYDVKSSKDNTLVFWGTQRNPLNQTGAILGGLDYAPRGVYAVDVRDKAAPKRVGFYPIPPNGVHTVRYYCMEPEDARQNATAPCAGRELLFVQTYDLTSTPLGWTQLKTLTAQIAPTFREIPVTQRIVVLDVIRSADDRVDLRPVSEISIRDPPQAGRGFRPHDSWPEVHPVTGDHLLYVSYWDHGVVTYNVNDPARPVLVSRHIDFLPSAFNNIHFARTHPGPIGGKHILVAEPELEVAPETGQYTTIDMTDPANPKKLGWWTLPGGLFIDRDFRFSPHNFGLANERIYLAHYHAGVWVVDISDPEFPSTLAYYQPHEPRPGWKGDTPRVWSAFYHEGLIYASDEASGLYVLHYAGDAWPASLGPAGDAPPAGVQGSVSSQSSGSTVARTATLQATS